MSIDEISFEEIREGDTIMQTITYPSGDVITQKGVVLSVFEDSVETANMILWPGVSDAATETFELLDRPEENFEVWGFVLDKYNDLWQLTDAGWWTLGTSQILDTGEFLADYGPVTRIKPPVAY